MNPRDHDAERPVSDGGGATRQSVSRRRFLGAVGAVVGLASLSERTHATDRASERQTPDDDTDRGREALTTQYGVDPANTGAHESGTTFEYEPVAGPQHTDDLQLQRVLNIVTDGENVYVVGEGLDGNPVVDHAGSNASLGWPTADPKPKSLSPVLTESGWVVVPTASGIEMRYPDGNPLWEVPRGPEPESELAYYAAADGEWAVYCARGELHRQPLGEDADHYGDSAGSLPSRATGAPAVVEDPDSGATLGVVATERGTIVAENWDGTDAGWRTARGYATGVHPVAVDGRVYTLAVDEEAVWLLTVDAADGQIVERTRLRDDGKRARDGDTESRRIGSLAATDERVVVHVEPSSGDGRHTVHGVPTGRDSVGLFEDESPWQTEVAADGTVENPVVSGESVLLAGAGSGVVCLDLSSGAHQWEVDVDGAESSVAVDGDEFYVGTTGGLVGFTARGEPVDTPGESSPPTDTSTESSPPTDTSTESSPPTDTPSPTDTVQPPRQCKVSSGLIAKHFPVYINGIKITDTGASILISITTPFIDSILSNIQIKKVIEKINYR